ncbi:MAG: two-component system cell cycle sensor histidine kinase/response regulator CckA, partial [Alphaproteobacteria bacterium]
MFEFPKGFLKLGMDIDEFTHYRHELAKKAKRHKQSSLEDALERGRDTSERTGERKLPNGITYTYTRKEMPGIGFVTTYTDISPIKKMERERSELSLQLYQSQKMDSIGQLAGGIAHDFNNILIIIDGYTRVAIKQPEAGEETKTSLGHVLDSSAKAASLTKQLLMFSRRDTISTNLVSARQVLRDVEAMLGPLLGEMIRLSVDGMTEDAMLDTDTAQLAQAIVNLAINARDAMPKVGKLNISMRAVDLDESYIEKHPHFSATSCVRIEVQDEGQGMDEDVVKCIFDPFFTTKDQGKGTGLGLAMVYGFVTQSKGAIEVESELGKGTLFRTHLPVSDQTPVTIAEVSDRSLIAKGETILLVEDEDNLRTLVQINLES